MLDSHYRRLCAVVLPFRGRQRYMHAFDLSAPVMEAGFEDYLDPVMKLCEAAGARSGIAHMTVDEKVVPAGQSQRRPKPHVDGRFEPKSMAWEHQSWDHSPGPRMAVIVASSVAGCRAWHGRFDAVPTDKGDLSHIADRLGEGEVLPANVGYWLSPDCVHESMVFDRDVQRTFLRIALPVAA